MKLKLDIAYPPWSRRREGLPEEMTKEELEAKAKRIKKNTDKRRNLSNVMWELKEIERRLKQ